MHALSILFLLAVPPQPQGRVSDFAGALSPAAEARLAQQIAGYEQGTSRQIAVAVFQSLEDESLEDFSMRLAEAWKIGGEKSSDGVIVLLFLDERKVRIEVGYGLEGALTDVQSKRIIREVLAPRLRAGDLEGALSATVAKIAELTAGAGGPAEARKPRPPPLGIIFLILGVVGAFVIVALIASKHGGGRGGRGGRGGGGAGFWIGTALGWTLGGMGGGGGSGWGSSGGGPFSGGGGSFGGGGASGDW
jgi:uncharacterized protein